MRLGLTPIVVVIVLVAAGCGFFDGPGEVPESTLEPLTSNMEQIGEQREHCPQGREPIGDCQRNVILGFGDSAEEASAQAAATLDNEGWSVGGMEDGEFTARKDDYCILVQVPETRSRMEDGSDRPLDLSFGYKGTLSDTLDEPWVFVTVTIDGCPFSLANHLAIQEVRDTSGACAASEEARAVERYEASPPSDLIQWAGFPDTVGLAVVGAAEACGPDALAAFALRGSSADIDAALAAAGFDVVPVPGVTVFQTPVEGADLDALLDPVSAEQEWESTQGERIIRKYVRGTLDDGQEELHVWAFTS